MNKEQREITLKPNWEIDGYFQEDGEETINKLLEEIDKQIEELYENEVEELYENEEDE
jgi:hypothetical protein